jgi:hypothetical protein
MDKTVQRHLEKRGVFLSRKSTHTASFSQRNSDCFKWFEESVLGFDSEKYYKEFWREAHKHGRTIGHRPITFRNSHKYASSRMANAEILSELVLCGSAFVIWFVRRTIDRHIQRLRRPTYYEVERARRHALTEERRKISKRRTINKVPTKKQLLCAFENAKDSPQDMIRFGSLIEDLECYVDNSPYFKNGKLIGRRGGIRRYLESEIPELYKRYKTVMKYKALSKRFRQAVGISDPIPASTLLPSKCKKETALNPKEIKIEDSRELISEQKYPEKDYTGNTSKKGPGEGIRNKGYQKCNEVNTQAVTQEKTKEYENIPMQAIKTANEIFNNCEGSVVSLWAQLMLRTDPELIPKNILTKVSKNGGAVAKCDKSVLIDKVLAS